MGISKNVVVEEFSNGRMDIHKELISELEQ